MTAVAGVGENTNTSLRRAEALVGLPYEAGTFDCGHLAVRAARELFGRDVHLPLNGHHPCSSREQMVAIALCRRQIAARVEVPDQGDVALFIEQTDLGHQWHLGTVVQSAPEVWILHTRFGGASKLQRLRDCQRFGLALEGWYRWT